MMRSITFQIYIQSHAVLGCNAEFLYPRQVFFEDVKGNHLGQLPGHEAFPGGL